MAILIGPPASSVARVMPAMPPPTMIRSASIRLASGKVRASMKAIVFPV
ncbi:MAG TPA: hypothetical protein PLH31_05175 [Caulobacter sp.]|nr:hypothetical protein [Caulobacter sp.]